jgi:hypothetical protein
MSEELPIEIEDTYGLRSATISFPSVGKSPTNYMRSCPSGKTYDLINLLKKYTLQENSRLVTLCRMVLVCLTQPKQNIVKSRAIGVDRLLEPKKLCLTSVV